MSYGPKAPHKSDSWQLILMDQITDFLFPFRSFGIGILEIQGGSPLSHLNEISKVKTFISKELGCAVLVGLSP